MLRDHRWLFPYASKKPGSWNHVRRLVHLSDRQISALVEMSFIEWPSRLNSYFGHSAIKTACAKNRASRAKGEEQVEPIEFLIAIQDRFNAFDDVGGLAGVPHPPGPLVELFYANTEGYEYPRYSLRIPDALVPTIISARILKDTLKSFDL